MEEEVTCCRCSTEEGLIEINGNLYCEDCIYTCNDCGEHLLENFGEGEIVLCENCRSDNYFVCDHCGNLYHNDNYQENGYCVDCYEPTDEEEYYSEYVNESDYKPKPIFFGTEGLKLGVELEIDSNNRNTSYQDFTEKLSFIGRERIYLKKDGSLSEVGVEIVSHPMDIHEHKGYNWQEILNLSKEYGYKSHDTNNCGLHIHINKNYLTCSEQIRLGIFIALNKEFIEKIARRKEERYAKFKEISGSLKDANKNNSGRYEAVNWNNQKTIEFRFFKGTLKYSTFIASIEFIHSVIGFVKETNVTTIVKSNVWELYLGHINKLKNYTILKEYLTEREVS